VNLRKGTAQKDRYVVHESLAQVIRFCVKAPTITQSRCCSETSFSRVQHNAHGGDSALLEEARKHALPHPHHIVHGIRHHQEEGEHLMVMEYVDGQSPLADPP